MSRASLWLLLAWALCSGASAAEPTTTTTTTATASSEQAGRSARSAIDGDRFSAAAGHAWSGRPGERSWWWQLDLGSEREVAAVLQVQGDHDFVLRNAPRSYTWRASRDGKAWTPLGAGAEHERRIFRRHRLREPVRARFLRLEIDAAHGQAPVLREVEVSGPGVDAAFPPWCVVLNCTHDIRLPGHGQEFIPLARSAPGWGELQAQQVALDSFDEAFLAAEPRPLCAFISGSFKDWCEVDRQTWRGVEEVLGNGRLPLWASCGGAQGLAILAETGTAKPWDCPHCRDPAAPKLPIYTHIGHTASKPCGDYSACVFERGPFTVRTVAADPAFAGLEREFRAMESHCGQIERAPSGWELIATGGAGTLTKTQCLRRRDRYIYAAQFHLEMAGTPETSRAIVRNFLELARAWGGYNPEGKRVAPPAPIDP